LLSFRDDGIVVVKGRKGYAMDIEQVPMALQERLGTEATSALLHVLDVAHREERASVIAACTDRFERRLVEEISSVRVQLTQVEASLRKDMSEMGAGIRQDMARIGAEIRQDMARMGGEIRQEMAGMGGEIRQEMARMGGDIRQDMATGRVELLKWCFLFWVGQVVALAAIMGTMLRMFRP
jgi:hypothetical protein